MPPEPDNEAEVVSHETTETTTPERVVRNSVGTWLFRVTFMAVLGVSALVGGMKEARANEFTIPATAAKAAEEPIHIFPEPGKDPKELAAKAFAESVPYLSLEQIQALFDFEEVERKPSGVVIMRAVPKQPKGAPESSGDGPDLEKARKLAQETQTNPLRVFPMPGQDPMDAAIDMFIKQAGLTQMTKKQVKAKFKFIPEKPKPSGLVFVKVKEKGVTLKPALKEEMSYRINECLVKTRKNYPDFRGKLLVTFYFKEGRLNKVELKGDQPKNAKADFEVEMLLNLSDLSFPKDQQSFTWPLRLK